MFETGRDFACNLTLADHVRHFDPSSVAVAELKPPICRIRRLMKRQSCSEILFKYLDRTGFTEVGHPMRNMILFISRIPAVLAPPLSITIVSGVPLFAKACAKNFVAAVVWRRSESMKSSVCPCLSAVRYRNLHELTNGFVAQRVIRQWIKFYNSGRSHTALEKSTPDVAYFDGKEMMK